MSTHIFWHALVDGVATSSASMSTPEYRVVCVIFADGGSFLLTLLTVATVLVFFCRNRLARPYEVTKLSVVTYLLFPR